MNFCHKQKNDIGILHSPSFKNLSRLAESPSFSASVNSIMSRPKSVWHSGLLLKVGRGRGDLGTRGLGEVGREDVGTRRRVGIRGRDKQITPDFCAELTVYKCKII